VPARAPSSIDMLQTVKRSSIVSASMADPAYSTNKPAPPSMPRRAMIERMRSFAVVCLGNRPIDGDAHRLRPGLPEGLGRQHVHRFGGADAEGERAQRTVRRGVRIAADDHHAGLGDPGLGRNDVQNSLALVLHADHVDAEFGTLGLETQDQVAPALVGDRGEPTRAVGGRHEMIRARDRVARTVNREVTALQGVDDVPPETLVQQTAIDVEQRFAAVERYDGVPLPDLIDERLRRHAHPAIP
jgi:hypothetical protein